MKEGKNPVGLLATKGGTISFKVERLTNNFDLNLSQT